MAIDSLIHQYLINKVIRLKSYLRNSLTPAQVERLQIRQVIHDGHNSIVSDPSAQTQVELSE